MSSIQSITPHHSRIGTARVNGLLEKMIRDGSGSADWSQSSNNAVAKTVGDSGRLIYLKGHAAYPAALIGEKGHEKSNCFSNDRDHDVSVRRLRDEA